MMCEGPFTVQNTEPCNKCQLVDCYSLHGNTLETCRHQGCDLCFHLAKLDEQICKIQDELIALAAQRRDVQRKINHSHDRLLSRLPIEFLSRVLLFAAATNEVDYKNSKGSHSTWSSPLLFGAVSRGWRNITLHTLQLWTEVTIDVYKDSLQFDVIKEWVRRSGALPLHLNLMGRIENMNTQLDLEPILELIRSHSNRWDDVEIHLPQPLLLRLFHDIDSPPLRVKHLYVDTIDGHLEHPQTTNGNNMGPTCMRQYLLPEVLHADYWTLSKLPFQWESLTSLITAIRKDSGTY